MQSVKCPQCGIVNFSGEIACKRCGADLRDVPLAAPTVPASTQAVATWGSVLAGRYGDAYATARGLIALGVVAKVLSGVVAGFLAFLVLLGAFTSALGRGGIGGGIYSIIAGLVLALLVGGAIYTVGVAFATSGQLLQAVIDIAVQTNPLATDDEKSRVLLGLK